MSLPWSQQDRLTNRVAVALDAVQAAGAALMVLRQGPVESREGEGGQLKTGVDLAAEGWVGGYLHGSFPCDEYLCEEAFENAGLPWTAPESFWTIDALDGTRSFVEGFDGFCVQTAWVSNGRPVVSAIYEPAAGASFVAIAGQGAFHCAAGGEWRRLRCQPMPDWPAAPRFVDSIPPRDVVGDLMARRNARFVECGSIGLKACRVAEGRADIYAKRLRFKLWDVAPPQVVITEAGLKLGRWNGRPISYDTPEVYFQNILVAPDGLFERVAAELVRERR